MWCSGFDGDRAGREAAWRALKIALPFMRQGWQAKFLFLPEGEDPDSLLRTQGRPAFDDLLRQAVPLSVSFSYKLAGEIDTHHLDGRARLVERAKPLLAKLPDSVFRHMMLTRLGEFSGVEPERLSMLIDKRPAATPARGISLSKTQRLARPPVRVVVALLLERPDLVRHVGNPERFAGLELPGVALLVRLAKLLGANPDLNIGALLERWRDTKDGEHLVRVARWNHGVPREDMEKEFIDTLCYLGKKLKEQRWEYLEMKLRKDGWGALTEVERQEWRRLPIELQRSRPSGN
jgi:DNA primase (bacterial type)